MEKEYKKHCLVLYYEKNVDGNEKNDEEPAPHGNAKRMSAPYISSSKTVLEKERELLKNLDSRPSMVYDEMLTKFNPHRTTS